MSRTIDINCDLGEGVGNDAILMPLISSCNIACGGHFGDAETIRTTIQLAVKHGVKIGAHPSFPDRTHFGRKIIQMSAQDLKASIIDQIQLFQEVAQSENQTCHHIKLHGALYNLAAKDESIAELMVDTIKDLDLRLKLYAPFGSVLSQLGRVHFEIIHEAFIDRRYQSDLALVERSNPLALITDPEQVWRQLYEIYDRRKVKSIDQKEIDIHAGTYCIHGDAPKAVDILVYIHRALAERNILLKPNA